MERLWRWLFNLAAGVSLLLCVAIAVLWTRSDRADKWERRQGSHSISLMTFRGKLLFERHAYTMMPFTGNPPTTMRSANEVEDPGMLPPGWMYSRWSGEQWMPREMHHPFTSLSAIDGGRSGSGDRQMSHIRRSRMLIVPLWGLLVVFLILPGLWMYRWTVNRKRSMPGCCLTCGYDLRATPERCPECGTEVEAAKGAAG